MVECTENSRDSKVLSDRLPATEFNKGLFLFLGILSGFLIYLASGYILSVLPKTLYLFYNCSIGLSIGAAVSFALSKGEYINKKPLLIITFLASLIPPCMFVVMNNLHCSMFHEALYVGNGIYSSWLSFFFLFAAIGVVYLLFSKQRNRFNKKNIIILILACLFFICLIKSLDGYYRFIVCYTLLAVFIIGIILPRIQYKYINTNIFISVIFLSPFILYFFMRVRYFLRNWIIFLLIIIFIFLCKNEHLRKNQLYLVATLFSLIAFWATFFTDRYFLAISDFIGKYDYLNVYECRVLIFIVFLYVLYNCLIFPIVTCFFMKNRKVNIENIFTLVLLSSFLVYIFFTFSLYMSPEEQLYRVSLGKDAGFGGFVSYVNEIADRKPLTTEQESYPTFPNDDEKNNVIVTSFLISLYNKITMNTIKDTLVLVNIQLWAIGFCLTIFFAWLFIIITGLNLFHHSKKGENINIQKGEPRKIILIFLMIFIILTVIMSQSLFMEQVSRINRSCSEGDLSKVKRFLSVTSFLTNFRDRDGYYPIHSAVLNNKKDVANFLVSKGADLNLDTYSSYRCFGTPLYMAADNGSVEMVEFLLANGADVNRKNRYNNTPLHVAAEKGYLEIVEILISAGADVNVKNKSRTHNYNREYVLVDYKAPLHCAIESHSIEIVKLLLDNGAEVNWKDFSGETPLDFAINGKYDPKIINLLKEHGAKKGSKL